MTPEEAFLAAILESPDDDTPRLVYADWLVERGDPRGEFIHVQCRLAVMAVDDARRLSLEESERRLLEQHQDDWLGAARPLLRQWTFRRGFLDAVRVPAATYMQHSPFRFPATVRRVEVDLEGFEVPAEVLAFVPESVAYENHLLPVGFRGPTLVLALQDPLDSDLLKKMRFILNRDIEAVAAPERQVDEAIRRHFGGPVFPEGEPDLLGCLALPPFPPEEVDLGSWANRNPAGRLLARLVAVAIGLDAREVRIGPETDSIGVRFVCGNEIVERAVAPIHHLWPVVTRLRIMAGIWVDDPREAQAGMIRLTVRGRPIEADVLVRRTKEGQTAVLTFREGQR